MLVKLNNVLHAIIPHISDSLNGWINKVGFVSVLSAGTNAIVTKSIEGQDASWLTISEVVSVVSIFGSSMFIVKIMVGIYFSWRKNQREDEAHKSRMNRSRSNNDDLN